MVKCGNRVYRVEVGVVQEFTRGDIVLVLCVGDLEELHSKRKITDEVDNSHGLIDNFHVCGLQLLQRGKKEKRINDQVFNALARFFAITQINTARTLQGLEVRGSTA